MINVIFKGFETIEQAQEFAEWYSGSGEQESGAWLEESTDIQSAYVENITTNPEGNVEVELKLYKK